MRLSIFRVHLFIFKILATSMLNKSFAHLASRTTPTISRLAPFAKSSKIENVSQTPDINQKYKQAFIAKDIKKDPIKINEPVNYHRKFSADVIPQKQVLSNRLKDFIENSKNFQHSRESKKSFNPSNFPNQLSSKKINLHKEKKPEGEASKNDYTKFYRKIIEMLLRRLRKYAKEDKSPDNEDNRNFDDDLGLTNFIDSFIETMDSSKKEDDAFDKKDFLNFQNEKESPEELLQIKEKIEHFNEFENPVVPDPIFEPKNLEDKNLKENIPSNEIHPNFEAKEIEKNIDLNPAGGDDTSKEKSVSSKK